MPESDDCGRPPEVEAFEALARYKIRGQPKAIEIFSKHYEFEISMDRNFGFNVDERGTRGNFMFLGPSGVGKTELARIIAEFFSAPLTKIDCSEYIEPHTISRLIGSPPGYIGYSEEPQLSPKRIFQEEVAAKKESRSDLKNEERKSLLGELRDIKRNLSSMGEQWYEINLELIHCNESMTNLENTSRHIYGPEIERTTKMLAHRLFETNTDMQGVLISMERLRRRRNEIYAALSKLTEPQAALEESKKTAGEKRTAVILFDEAEKASGEFHNLCLQMMDDGALTMGNGKKVNLNYSFLIFTSNVAGREISRAMNPRQIGFNKEIRLLENNITGIVEKEMKNKFSPEFRNRLDAVIIFRPLDRQALFEILDMNISEFSKKLKDKKNIEFKVEEPVMWDLIEKSTRRLDGGARLLRHKLKTNLFLHLGRKLGKSPQFRGMVTAKLLNGKLDFELSSTG